jgi:hypothetical protein
MQSSSNQQRTLGGTQYIGSNTSHTGNTMPKFEPIDWENKSAIDQQSVFDTSQYSNHGPFADARQIVERKSQIGNRTPKRSKRGHKTPETLHNRGK